MWLRVGSDGGLQYIFILLVSSLKAEHFVTTWVIAVSERVHNEASALNM